MSAFQQSRTSGNTLRSSICLVLALPIVFMLAAAPQQAAAEGEHPSGKQFAYVSDLGSGKVLGYIVRMDGKLTPIAGSPFSAGTSAP